MTAAARHIYILVREDLQPLTLMVQAAHAVVEAARKFLPQDEIHPNFVLCGVADERALTKALNKATDNNVRMACWWEPDLGKQMTAIASEPIEGERRLVFRHYRLLRDCQKVHL